MLSREKRRSIGGRWSAAGAGPREVIDVVTIRRMVVVVPVLIGLTLALGYAVRSEADGGSGNGGSFPMAILHTSAGDITLLLRDDCAPHAVRAFIRNCEVGAYDGTAFLEACRSWSRVYGGVFLPDGSLNLPTRAFQAREREPNNGLTHVRGRVGIRAYGGAAGGLNPSKQFYVCLAPCPAQDGKSTLFGDVIAGMEIFDQIAASAPGGKGTPAFVVSINNVEISR